MTRPEDDPQAWITDDPQAWIAASQTALIRELSQVLDLDAGLRDALLPGRHAAVIDDLHSALDVGAGLAAIVPATEPASPLRTRAATTPSTDRPGGPETATARHLRALSPPERLALRGHPAIVGLVLVLRLDIVVNLAGGLMRTPGRDLALALGRNLTLARDLAREFDLDLGWDLAFDLDASYDRIRGLARYLAHDHAAVHAEADTLTRDMAVDLVLTRARVLARVLDRALDRMPSPGRGLADVFVTDLSHGRDLARACDRARALAEAFTVQPELDTAVNGALLDDLVRARNDFTEADLRDANLVGVPLIGVRWSLTTRWPPAWRELIEQRSEEVEPGVFEIRDGMADVDTAMALVDS
ncbi:hypothetical protein [Frankia sp. QA3]|uniref:hypothetical protein n=1 Tax=Frankia sp. QA3 TaxID=710111 RepID=UPI000269CF6C|nr:hypothetical protein [Frankia sp. QA3]EIV96337.1 hypothetical protein FraQA3DRAFT_6224 [Frankia sp. QA3]